MILIKLNPITMMVTSNNKTVITITTRTITRTVVITIILIITVIKIIQY